MSHPTTSLNLSGMLSTKSQSQKVTYILYHFIYINFLKWQNYSNREEMGGCHGVEHQTIKVERREYVCVDGTALCPDCGGVHTNQYLGWNFIVPQKYI